MADPFLHLSVEDRREALGIAADRSGRRLRTSWRRMSGWSGRSPSFLARRSANIWCSRAARRCPKPIRSFGGFLEEDYARMVDDGLLLEDAEPFDALMARCADIADIADIAERANRVRE